MRLTQDLANAIIPWHLQLGVNNGRENQNHLPSSMYCSARTFSCHCLSAQGGLGMLCKKGEEKVVIPIKSNCSNVTQGSRDT